MIPRLLRERLDRVERLRPLLDLGLAVSPQRHLTLQREGPKVQLPRALAKRDAAKLVGKRVK